MAQRQQLSADNLAMIQRCIAGERDRLTKLHWAMVPFKLNEESILAMQAEVRALDEAESQLTALFLDQFEAGRQENDEKGRTGLKRVA
jgi:hypothetical protein